MAKEKDWLIRTSNFQVLGPVSKEKIIQFVEKGSLKGEDELTSGNGYWFLVKEKDLLDKYIYGDIPQTFNPISEAPNVLTGNQSGDHTGTHNKITKPEPMRSNPAVEGEDTLPADDDLEYPDMNLPAGEDLDYPDMGSPSGELDIDKLEVTPGVTPGVAPKEEVAEATEDLVDGLQPTEADLEYPDMGDMGSPVEASTDEFEEVTDPGIAPAVEEVTPKKVKAKPSRKLNIKPIEDEEEIDEDDEIEEQAPKKTKSGPKQRNDKLLFLLVGIFFVSLLLAAILFYYKKVLNKPLPFISSTVEFIIPSASAQVVPINSLTKKKVFLTFKK